MKICMKYIRKTYPEARKNLEKQLLLSENKDEINKLMEANEKIISQVNDVLKFHFDVRRHGLILFCICDGAIVILILFLAVASQHS